MARVEEMLGSIPGESWALVDRDGRLLYAVGPPGGLVGHGTLPGAHIAEHAHPDDLPAVLDAMQAVLAHPGSPVRVLSRARHADGSWNVYEVTAVNRLDDPALGAVAVRSREVTDGPAADDITLIESLAEAVPTPILVADHAGTVLYSNAAAQTLLGEELPSVARRIAVEPVPSTSTIQVEDRWVQVRTAERSDGWVAMLDDITPQHRLATRDALTGLANRAAFDDRLRSQLASPAHAPVSVVFIDLDEFKAVNDRHGHAAGDRVLQLVAERLRSEVRPDDVVARIGGDEFAVVCGDLRPESAERLCERLASAMEQPFEVDGASVRVGASVGSATSPPAPSDPAGLLAAADRVMYESKPR